MRSALAIAGREFRELRLALAGAAIVGLLPLVPLAWPGGPHPRDVAAAVLAELIGCALLAPVVGTIVLGSDLAHQRLGFYFARPVSGFGVWAGKVAGGAAVVAVASLLATLPGALAAGGIHGLSSEIFAPSAWPGPGDVFLVLAALYCLAIGGGIVVRSRSGFATLDLLALAAATFFAVQILHGLVLCQVIEDSPSAAEWAASAFAVTVLAASAAAVAEGRVDRRRVHAIFSTVLWSLTAIAIAVSGALELWIRSASPASIETVFSLAAAPRSGWINIAGRTRNRFGYAAEFLVDSETGRFYRLGGGLLAAESLAFSADGRRAAWWEPESGGQYSGAHLAVLDLESPDRQPRRSTITRPDRWGGRLVLDRDGSRVFLLGVEQISIYEIGSDRLLASVRIPGHGADIVHGFFTGPSGFRFVAHPGAISGVPKGILEVTDIDFTTRRLLRRASFPVSSKLPLVVVSASQDRLLVTGAQEPFLRLLDIDSGAELARIPNDPGLRRASVRFLSDGRSAFLDDAGGSARLRLLSSRGAELSAIPLGKSKLAALGGEIAPGVLVAALGDGATEMRAVSIDVDRATVHAIGDHLIPAGTYAPAITLDPSTLALPGSPATRLFFTPSGGLVSIDPATGKRRVILAGRDRR